MIKLLLLKEIKLFLQDLHGLAVVFLMPMLFLLIMSLALPGEETDSKGPRLGLLKSAEVDLLEHLLRHDGFFDIEYFADLDGLTAAIDEQMVDATLLIERPAAAKPLVNVGLSPALSPLLQTQFKQYLETVLARDKLHAFLLDLEYIDPDETVERRIDLLDSLIENPGLEVRVQGGQGREPPNAVEQGFPSWLIFGMFFVVMPLSNALLKERSSATLMRLKSLRVSPELILLGKFLPYFGINALQFVLLLATALYLVPLAGGATLRLPGHWFIYLLVFIAISCAALGFGLLIATSARTTEQAIALGGGLNLLMAAIGGIMIPKHLMAEEIASMSWLSPMSWAQSLFFDLIIYQKTLIEMLGSLSITFLFGAGCLFLAGLVFRRQYQVLQWT